jgi:hypothetical protein
MNASPDGGVDRRPISSQQHHRHCDEDGKHTQGHTEHDDAGGNPRQERLWMKKGQRQEKEPKKDWCKTNDDQYIATFRLATGVTGDA